VNGNYPDEHEYVLIYDLKLRRPGCVLLQVFGGTVPRDLFFELFDGTDWLLAPTPDLKAYRMTRSDLEQASRISKRRD
jgi:hypothetical protein